MAAYFVSSALFSSINIIGLPCLTKGAYKSFKIFTACGLSVPITTRSGFMKSSTATPSLKNSGLLTTANDDKVAPASSNAAVTFSAVPTGTVLLSIIILKSSCLIRVPKSLAAPNTYDRSALPFSPGGVGNAKKIMAASLTASARLPVNFNRPSFWLRRKSFSNPGS